MKTLLNNTFKVGKILILENKKHYVLLFDISFFLFYLLQIPEEIEEEQRKIMFHKLAAVLQQASDMKH